MLDLFIKNCIYELCITKFFEQVSINLFNRRMLDNNFNYNKCIKQYETLMSSANIPNYAYKIVSRSIHEQKIYNLMHLNNKYQHCSIRLLYGIFKAANTFKIGDRYNPTLKYKVNFSPSTIIHHHGISEDEIYTLILNIVEFQILRYIKNQEVNGMFFIIDEQSEQLLIYH